MVKNTIDSGNSNTQINGDNNTVNLSINPNKLTKSIIYKLLVIIDNSDISISGEFSLKAPAEMNRKLVFNKAPKYVHIFARYAYNLENFSQVLENCFENSQNILVKVANIFDEKAAKFDDNAEYVIDNGDIQLDIVKKNLIFCILNDPRYNENEYDDITIESFVYILMAYTVEKCKILLNPNDVRK
ncbi:hypothetical protein H5S40_10530 [Limosilactobacillus sp. RRLNB_1_1]|uniref:Uncharacterized protein n=1 Tax=Limosilactobacillus albertensis TaxID=2759752 RepID=A0A7W3TTF6_9LACO|nr:hypothetical protein [Limosilactobacillus albertensis]MBB1070580.1 hypothetical protein [Limosilactobacillus albertensis]MCD7118955.1 hypothetical protein [Limosilactobacillus albertensis]MCD7129094.1 hypothetical protein [Limosilactobacillus albertensis]